MLLGYSVDTHEPQLSGTGTPEIRTLFLVLLPVLPSNLSVFQSEKKVHACLETLTEVC